MNRLKGTHRGVGLPGPRGRMGMGLPVSQTDPDQKKKLVGENDEKQEDEGATAK